MGMLDSANSVLVIIDIQEKLVNAALNGENTITNAAKISKAAEILNIQTIITEQYPKGLGQTIECIKNNNAKIIEKTSFSAYQEKEFKQAIDSLNKKQIILCGIEGHICVLQTAIELKQQGYEVFVLKDCTSSRNEFELNAGFDVMQQQGINTTCVEITLFQWLRTSKHPHFKEIQKLII